MTETSTLPVELTSIEPEFAKPCQFYIPPMQCPHPATFAVWSTHTTQLGCPGTFYICDTCMDKAVEFVGIALDHHCRCNACHKTYVGLLTDNVRFIKL